MKFNTANSASIHRVVHECLDDRGQCGPLSRHLRPSSAGDALPKDLGVPLHSDGPHGAAASTRVHRGFQGRRGFLGPPGRRGRGVSLNRSSSLYVLHRIHQDLSTWQVKAMIQILICHSFILDCACCDGGNWCCSQSSPCIVGEGDCDDNGDCALNLICGQDNCVGDTFHWTDDSCELVPFRAHTYIEEGF